MMTSATTRLWATGQRLAALSLLTLCCLCGQVLAGAQAASRPLLDIVDIQGIRDNQLVGYGLVVGLPGSGDKAQVKFAAQSLNNMLKQFGVQLDEATLPKSKNVAAVAVQATLPPMGSPGQAMMSPLCRWVMPKVCMAAV